MSIWASKLLQGVSATAQFMTTPGLGTLVRFTVDGFVKENALWKHGRQALVNPP